MLTTDEQALMNAIVAAPDDDAPRLIYADWLDENGQPERAEFIRVQCELARLPRWKCREELLREDELQRREQALLTSYAAQWFGMGLESNSVSVSEAGCATVERRITRRGFVENGELHNRDWASQWTDLFRHPLLSGLIVHFLTATMADGIVSRAELAQLRRLDIRAYHRIMGSPDAIRRLLDQENITTQLQALGIFGNAGSSEEAAQFLPFRCFTAVTNLTFHFDPDYLIPFVSFGNMPNIRHLDLYSGYIDPRSCPDLHEEANFAELESLSLAGVTLLPENIENLVTSRFWSKLRTLKLDVSDPPHFPSRGPPPVIVRYRLLDQLSSHVAASLEEFAYVAGRLHETDVLHGTLLTSVRRLELRLLNDELDADLILDMADSEYTRNLRSVRFAGTGDSMDRVAEALAISPGFNHLLEVDLSETPLTNRGALALANAPHLRDLTRLTLSGCNLDATVLDALRDRFPIVRH